MLSAVCELVVKDSHRIVVEEAASVKFGDAKLVEPSCRTALQVSGVQLAETAHSPRLPLVLFAVRQNLSGTCGRVEVAEDNGLNVSVKRLLRRIDSTCEHVTVNPFQMSALKVSALRLDNPAAFLEPEIL